MSQISIIVPIYNVELYLNECIESIVNQSFENLEIILINDGSTDSSGSICDTWGKKDSRIRVIHKKNEGVTIARKTGVEYAIAEWVCFVDSDDELPEQSINTLFKHARDDVDIIIGELKCDGYFKVSHRHNYEEQNSLQYLKSLLKNKVHGGPVARLIRKNLFDAFIFDIPQEITKGEDIIMNVRLAQKVRKIILLPDIVYHYLLRSSSVSSENDFFKINISYQILWNRIVSQSINKNYKKHLRSTLFYFYCRQLWWLLLKKPIMLLVRNIKNLCKG